MSLYKRGSVWWVDFTVQGRRIQESTGTADRTAAQEYHDRRKAEVWRERKLGARPVFLWQDAVIRWVRETADKASHARDLEKLRWLSPRLEGVRLDQITRNMIESILQEKEREVAPATVNRYLALIRAILRKAEREWDMLERAPALRMRKEPKRRVRWLTREEADRLLEALPGWLRPAALFTLHTGLRQQNCFGLEWSQVDLARQVAWVHPDQAKARKSIRVPLNATALSVLRGQIGKHTRWVFVNSVGERIAGLSTRHWKSLLTKAGLTDFRWHDLRHTWASWHVQSGTTLQELMELGGWSSYDMVLRYAHLATGHLAEAAGRLDVTKSPTPALRVIDGGKVTD